MKNRVIIAGSRTCPEWDDMKELIKNEIDIKIFHFHKLFCPRIYKNEFGVEIIDLDGIVLTKFCKVLFFTRKYDVNLNGQSASLSNKDKRELYEYAKQALKII